MQKDSQLMKLYEKETKKEILNGIKYHRDLKLLTI